ncbi:TonB-dependent receptor [Pseudoxanthomonas sangjuensis]|uniref:TonB-dependent receptor n=1 Tax=Pseudoxanthomonas sangjuensis TaxID=1503750 RepID=UPI001391E567|nr:TonB-dependent receptor [Pseudoxanthomonas sangjuensis]KAF1715823.1 TonB-dependent receptor [Pseudoxanthomonas sangjuensis]
MQKQAIRANGRVVGARLCRHIHRSALATGVVLALSAGALHAQDAPPPPADGNKQPEATALDAVVVTGVRGSIIRAQDIKQDAEQIVDSITAEDIGALPDRSVTETIKRISGVTVTGFASRDDTDHFSAEGSGVMIRGLTFVRGELNGRDVFSASGGRGINFEEVPAELMAGVDVYKNPSAEIIEGGLGGTVNLRTRKPFDEAGRKIAGSIDYNYGDKAKDAKPSASFLFSDRWETGAGEMGFLANLSYSEMSTRSDGIQLMPFDRRGRKPAEQTEGSETDWVYDWDAGSWQSAESQRDALLAGSGLDQVFVPGGVNWRRTDFERKRQGGALAFQWRPSEDTELYAQFITSQYDMTWNEHFMEFAGASQKNQPNWNGVADHYNPIYQDGLADMSNNLIPALGTRFEYDENGRFIRGTVRQGGWTGQPSDLDNGNPGVYQGNTGIQFVSGNRINAQESKTTDWAAGFQHYITDRLTARGDFQYVKSESSNVDFSLHASTLLQGMTIDLGGKYPSVTVADPSTVTDQSNYFWRSAMDHLGDSEGVERAGRVDLEYTFQDGDWLRFFRWGARVADRSYRNLFTTWNWGVISDDWNKLTGANADPTRANVAWLDLYQTGDSELYSMDDFFGGGANMPTQFWSPKNSMVDIGAVASTLALLPNAKWRPIAYGPDSTNTQDERTQAGYGVLYFGGDKVDGNVGVRVVKTSVDTIGGGTMPNMESWAEVVTPEVLAKFAGQSFSTETKSSYTDVLPSLNLRVRFGEGWQWRFAASKAIARPEFRLMQAWLPLQASAAACEDAISDGLREPGSCGEADMSFTGNGGNPELKPMRATQFDTSLEWYFGPGNSLYATLFYKNVEGYFASMATTETLFGNDYLITRTHNLDEGKIRGFEVGYSQFFDFLPGFGVQANYTFVDSSGGTNAVVSPYASAARAGAVDLPLEGLSKRSYNAIAIYEKGKISMRLAYNWRSRYLLTSSDAITFLPTWNDDYGQVDGSFFYNIGKGMQLGVQVNNLTNSVTKLLVGPRKYLRDGYVDDTMYTRAWFENDRRYSLVLRGSW